jgi:hypothetical protein
LDAAGVRPSQSSFGMKKKPNRSLARTERASAARWTSIHAAEYGMQYYVAGRYGIMNQFSPTPANQLHHAVEFFLKSFLAKKDSWATILRYGYSPNAKNKKRGGYYGHDIRKLWRAYRRRNRDPALAVHDDVVRRLHRFEEVRYPVDLVTRGGMFCLSRYETTAPKRNRKSRVASDRYFFISLPEVDRLCKLLLDSCGYNGHLLSRLAQQPEARRHYRRDNSSPIKPKRTAPRIALPVTVIAIDDND